MDAPSPTPDAVPDTWAVVVNWNGAKLLPACLTALLRSSRPAHVVVVDNGSTDGSAAAVAAMPGVEWLPMGHNAGFAAANNVALRRALDAGARWIALVNPDVVVEPTWLQRLVEAGDAHPEAGILGGLMVFADDPARVNSTGLVLDRWGRAFDRDFGVPLAALATRDGPVPGVTGGAALLRATLLRRVGVFDPAYWAYYEDVDLCARALEAGFACWYVAAARAAHGYGKSFGAGSPRQRYLLARNHLRFVAAHQPVLRAVATATLFTVARAAVKAPLELMRRRPAHALAHLRGAGAGGVGAIRRLAARVRGGAVPPGAEPPGAAGPKT